MSTREDVLNELRQLIKKTITEIKMFHDPRMIHRFEDENVKWENGALWVRVNMLKNIIGIKDPKTAEINAVELENKSWDEVKQIFGK